MTSRISQDSTVFIYKTQNQLRTISFFPPWLWAQVAYSITSVQGGGTWLKGCYSCIICMSFVGMTGNPSLVGKCFEDKSWLIWDVLLYAGNMHCFYWLKNEAVSANEQGKYSYGGIPNKDAQRRKVEWRRHHEPIKGVICWSITWKPQHHGNTHINRNGY